MQEAQMTLCSLTKSNCFPSAMPLQTVSPAAFSIWLWRWQRASRFQMWSSVALLRQRVLDGWYYRVNKSQTFVCWSSAPCLACSLFQNFLATSSCPEIQGYLYVKEVGRKSWKKVYMFLRRSGLYCSTKGTSKVTATQSFHLQGTEYISL